MMKRREFLSGMCGVGAVMATAGLPAWGEEENFFPGRGRFERLVLNYVHLRIGLAKPFSVLHISDTHLADAYPDEPKAKLEQRLNRMRCFGGRQEEIGEGQTPMVGFEWCGCPVKIAEDWVRGDGMRAEVFSFENESLGCGWEAAWRGRRRVMRQPKAASRSEGAKALRRRYWGVVEEGVAKFESVGLGWLL